MKHTAMKKFTILVLIISGMGFPLKAQEPLRHEKRVFVSPEGKVFINKSLPVYLRLSTSAGKQDKTYLLQSTLTPAYVNPMYLDVEGYNSLRTPWAVDTVTKEPVYPKQYIVYEVYADSKPPVTAIHYDSLRTFVKAGKTYVNQEVDINLKASDEISGVENIYYSVDGEPFRIFSLPLKLQQEREYSLKYYAADQVGNAESPHTVNIILDLSKPQSSVEISGDRFENILSGRSKIIIKAEDKGIGVDKISYKMDDAGWQKYQLSLPASAMAQGEHKISYYAVDLTGKREEEKNFDFYVDKTPPVMVQELVGRSFIAGGKEYTSGKNQIKLTSFDNKAGVKEVFYSVNNAAYVKYEKPFYLSDVKGDLILKAYAVDNVGNKTESLEKGESLTIPYIDLSGPMVNHYFNGPSFVIRDTLIVSSKTKIFLKATDSESGVNRIDYTIDGAEPVLYSGPFSLEKEGIHTLNFTGYDNVENTGQSEFTVIVDNTGPAITSQYSIPSRQTKISGGKNIPVFPGHLVVFLSCTDETVGFDAMYYTLNEIPEKRYAGLIGNFLLTGDYTLKIRALDKLGNESGKEISFSIEK
jgi:hypothetical protein